MRKISFLFLVSFLMCFVCSAQEDITITTYYPAPFGVYKDLQAETVLVTNDDEEILIGDDADNPSIVLRDLDGVGNNPYIDFSNDAAAGYDMRITLLGDDSLSIEGGVTEFTDNDGDPAVVKSGEFWHCTDY